MKKNRKKYNHSKKQMMEEELMKIQEKEIETELEKVRREKKENTVSVKFTIKTMDKHMREHLHPKEICINLSEYKFSRLFAIQRFCEEFMEGRSDEYFNGFIIIPENELDRTKSRII